MYAILVAIVYFITCIHSEERVLGNAEPLQQEDSMKLQMIYWPLRPFIFLEENLFPTWNGIIPILFMNGGMICANMKIDILQLTVNLKSKQLHDNTLKNYTHMKYGEGVLKNITTPNAVVWGPVNIFPGKVSPYYIHKRELGLYPIMTSNQLAVIHKRSKIALHIKILRGISKCDKIIFMTALFALLFGCLVWIYERSYNPAFKVRTGIGTSIYWSFVTMTTVGYGDVTPVTFLGRTIAVTWMFFGLMIASVMTATLTDTVIGIRGLEIENNEIAVLKDSHEEHIIDRDYNARPNLYESYEEVIEAVRQDKVYAAVVPVEVAAWMQEKIRDPLNENPLSIVYTIPGKVKFNILISNQPFNESEEFFRCIFSTFKEAVVKDTLDYFDRNVYIETIYYDDITLSIFKDPVYIAILVISILILSATISLNFIEWSKRLPIQIQIKEKEKNIDSFITELRNLLADYQRIKSGRSIKDRPIIKVQPPQ